jgi:hypothetical protein
MGHTLNEEYNIGSPQTSCDSCNHPILVPNGDSGGIYEFRKAGMPQKKTYIRSTINSEEQTRTK